MIRNFKRTFFAVLRNHRLTDEVISTTFCLVEQCLHNRPLTAVSDDPTGLDTLAPNHFLPKAVRQRTAVRPRNLDPLVARVSTEFEPSLEVGYPSL